MGLIRDYLFGRQIKFQDSKLGELTTKIKTENPSINYTWAGTIKLSGQRKETYFILEGNSTGPYKSQLGSVHRIIDSLDNIIVTIDKELKGRQNIKPRFMKEWTKDYHLGMVTPYDPYVKGIERKFELNFEPLDEDDLEYVNLVWDNDRLVEIRTL
jgi:hypothetical protein